MSREKASVAAQVATEFLVNEKKWSKVLMSAGWTAIPSVIIERQKALGLDALDFNIIMHLASYWWTHDNKPHPSKRTIAEAVGVLPRTVQRRIADLERTGLIKREERRVRGKGSLSNRYHFDGLIKAAQPFAKEKLEEIEERRETKKSTVARKGRAKLRLVKSDGSEE
ncbi:MAG TPA: helix-turn-helix domain-containing protein [Terracidiphilus sp.]|jgi:DNA-binding transcriptional regulator YhcF (GntR family)|nr:helix-turn-helix domain-containing protein [Terracidiphilus sp.]